MPPSPEHRDHELRLALEQARLSLEEFGALRLQAAIPGSLAEWTEIVEVHTRWLVDLDRKLEHIADLLLKAQGGRGHAG